MLTDLDAVDLIQLSYQADSKWDFLWRGPSDDDLTVCVLRIGGLTAIVFPGTTDVQGWLRDFEAVDATPHDHPQLGPVHVGFWAGMDQAYQILDQQRFLDGPLLVAGHSLGAARAILFSGLLTAAGKPPLAIVTCGEPRAGMAALVRLLEPVPIRSYRNREDPVWAVPFHLPLFGYDHPRPPIALDAAPMANDPWGPLADHHIELYAAGVGALDPAPSI
jgi:hypothetical protein